MQRIHVAAAIALALVASTGVARAQGEHGRGRGHEGGPPPVAAEEQQRRIHEEQQRMTDYRRHLDDDVRAQQQRDAQLQAQKRQAQYRFQQEYAAQLARQQEQLRAERDYAHEGYITAPHAYRFRVGGVYRETNQYGVDLLRQAINHGYQQGFRAGEADRRDHWRFDYTNSPAYREATYGYAGSFVDQADYSYYFRQGFQRGYEDGYYSRFRYGSSANGTYSILGNVLNGILQLTTIR
jgi:hypothetical protein